MDYRLGLLAYGIPLFLPDPQQLPRRMRFRCFEAGRRPQAYGPLSERCEPKDLASQAYAVSPSSDVSEILSPIPDRHLLESHQQRWLYSPSLSPAPSSRAISPGSQSVHTRARSKRNISFSTLMENERPRRTSVSPSFLRHGTRAKSKSVLAEEHSMGKRWVRWMHKNGMKQLVVPAAIAGSLWVRWAIGLASYSGMSATNGLIMSAHAFVQDKIPRQCMVITRRKDIGWNLR